MDAKAEAREFLTTRRARLTPEAAGLPVYGGNRRVSGLRREEVAMLAGVSVDYYVRLERGNLGGASAEVLAGVSRALQLDADEHEHLHDLARRIGTRPAPRRSPPRRGISAAVRQVLDAMVDAPAWARDARHDVLATNRLGRALLAPMFTGGRPNSTRFTFLDPAAREFWGNWEHAADDSAAFLRTAVARDPGDETLVNLVGELATRSEEFRQRWARHDVRFHRSGTKVINHPDVGRLDLSYQAMELPADPGLVLVVYTAEPDSRTADGLRLLASWTADQHERVRSS